MFLFERKVEMYLCKSCVIYESLNFMDRVKSSDTFKMIKVCTWWFDLMNPSHRCDIQLTSKMPRLVPLYMRMLTGKTSWEAMGEEGVVYEKCYSHIKFFVRMGPR